ncbi:hypothetical protein B5F40_11780 [Gordonibacter sp. An230]|nr:hypothetical protein B5F40_11780 [Gordonibacter sp. An230]
MPICASFPANLAVSASAASLSMPQRSPLKGLLNQSAQRARFGLGRLGARRPLKAVCERGARASSYLFAKGLSFFM